VVLRGVRWVLALPLVLVLGVSACSSNRPATPVGCGMVGKAPLTGLLGGDMRSVAHGSLAALRAHGRPASCATSAAGDPARYVVVQAVRHPRPLKLPARACNQGWVYAGTPDKYAPACQSATRHGGRTVLLARWGEYVVRVTIGRPNRDWGGDPEIALAMSQQVGRRLGVPEARQSASGSSS
jgi:hypothetical protein